MITNEIEKIITDSAKQLGFDEEFKVSFSALNICDFQCNNCFALAKKYGMKPFDIASKIVDNIKGSDFYTFEAVMPAFINVKLTDKCLEKICEEFLKDEMGGLEKHKNPQKVILDYGGANIAKALHVGHLRSPIIGEGLKRLYKLLGDEVISDVHLGDWGLQMGLTELELFEEGKLDYYFSGKGEKVQITLDMLNEAYPKASAKKNVDEDFKARAEEWTLNIQQKKQPYYDIYQEIKRVSVGEIERHYKELGATFDLWLGESDADEYINKALKIIDDKGLARVSEGALVVDVAVEGENIPIPKRDENEEQRYKNPMPPAVLKKQNGGVLYATTDIATILMRNENFGKVDRIEYIVDERQRNHFTQVFRVCKMSGISPEGQELVHVGYGTMNGKDGKPFKTRSGDTVKLEDVVNMLIDGASNKLNSNGVEPSRELALKIGVGAMRFGDLINNVGKDYVFDFDKFLSFEGKTGPYLQYTMVRINSILNKANLAAGKFEIHFDEEREIIKSILKLNSAYEICYKEKSLNNLCSALFDLASAFSTFYNNHSVLGEKDEKIKQGFISLLTLVKKKIEQGLNVVAIEIPEKM